VESNIGGFGSQRLRKAAQMVDLPLASPKLLSNVGAASLAKPNLIPRTELDIDENVRLAIDWLETEAPKAISHSEKGGNNTSYWVACRVKDYGISESLIPELLRDHWNERNEPCWDWDELKLFAENAYHYGKKAPGIRAPTDAADDFNVVDLTGNPAAKSSLGRAPARLHFLSFKESIDRAAQDTSDPLVKGLLECGAMSVLYGDSNVGKTFVALDIANSIASGRAWNGRKVRRGLVIYVAAEGGRGIHRRNEAWQRKRDTHPDDVLLAVVPCSVDLRSTPGDHSELVALVRDAEKRFGEPAVLIVIDTLSRALAGGDENSSVDMGAFIRSCDRLRSRTSAHLMVVHHTGKDKARGARGWSGIRAAIDTEIEIADGKIAVTKQRDLEPIKVIRFDLKQVHLRQDADGDPITSAVAIIQTSSEFEKTPLSASAELMWEAFQLAAKEATADGDWRSTIVHTDQWEEEFRQLKIVGTAIAATAKGVAPRTLRQLRQDVAESGRVQKRSDNQWLAG
jgi:hypothetical protein